ncbi:MAG: HAMP domain-containing histidine kinase [Bdellovibrionaceae bacterium]|nr:HAMP domain-containing histidine kinase [Bdellovibrio sp.]
MISALILTYFEVSHSLAKANREVLNSKWREAATLLSKNGLPGLKDYLLAEQNSLRNVDFMFRVVNKENQTLFLKTSIQDAEFDFDKDFHSPFSKNGNYWHTIQAINDEDRFEILTGPVGFGYFLQIGRSNEDIDNVLERIVSIFSMMTGLFVMVSVVFGFWYARKSSEPIRALSKTIASIENGNLAGRVQTYDRQDELNQLGETFNRMIGRIEHLVHSMKESLDNVAHEIRTPLTRIRVIAERALISNDPKKMQPALEECSENIQEIAALVEQILDIAEAESGALILKCEITNIKKLLLEIVDIYDLIAEEKHIKINLEAAHDLFFKVDRTRIKRAVANLLDNAIKYSNDNTQVTIIAHLNGADLLISVSDQGHGILPSDLPRIWDRLFRGDKSRTSSGLGLGLSLVKSIVQAHGGRINAVANLNGNGTNFIIHLPQA